jgi:hypothetical protein
MKKKENYINMLQKLQITYEDTIFLCHNNSKFQKYFK